MTIEEIQTLNEGQGQEAKVLCSRCDGETCHKVLLSVEQTREEILNNNSDFVLWTSYQIIQCQGCKTISFRQASSDSRDYYPEHDGLRVNEIIYPSPIKDKKGLEKLCLLPPQVEDIYTETLQALNNGYLILAGIGIRALVESVCNEKSAKGRELFGKINDLKENHILTFANAEILHKIRTLGNDAAHEVKKHKKQELELAMNVVEHLLTDVYILPQQAKKLPEQAKKLPTSK